MRGRYGAISVVTLSDTTHVFGVRLGKRQAVINGLADGFSPLRLSRRSVVLRNRAGIAPAFHEGLRSV